MKTDNNGQIFGGSADILSRIGKDELIRLWHFAAEKLKDINPMEDYESYESYRTLLDRIVESYYSGSIQR